MFGTVEVRGTRYVLLCPAAPPLISNIALVVYIVLGSIIGVLAVLNLIFGFHLILTFLLVVFVFILLILLTDNIGLDR